MSGSGGSFKGFLQCHLTLHSSLTHSWKDLLHRTTPISLKVCFHFVCVGVCLCTHLWKPVEGVRSPWDWSFRWLCAAWTWSGFWELNVGPLGKQQALFTDEILLELWYHTYSSVLFLQCAALSSWPRVFLDAISLIMLQDLLYLGPGTSNFHYILDEWRERLSRTCGH